MRMAYQRTGGGLIHWNRGRSPGSTIGQGRAADALSLGNYEPCPKAGGPEIIGDDSIGPFPAASNLLTLAAVGGAVWYFALGGKKYIDGKRKK